MQVVQTAGAPPNHGRIALATMGCTWNSRKAPRKIEAANVGLVWSSEFMRFMNDGNGAATPESANRARGRPRQDIPDAQLEGLIPVLDRQRDIRGNLPVGAQEEVSGVEQVDSARRLIDDVQPDDMRRRVRGVTADRERKAVLRPLYRESQLERTIRKDPDHHGVARRQIRLE